MRSLFNLDPLQLSELPEHAELDQAQKGKSISPPIFAETALNRAHGVVHSVWEGFKESGERSSPGSTAKVKIVSGKHIDADDSGAGSTQSPGFWAGRESIHQDSQTDGTGTYSEFDSYIRLNHSWHEMSYTPDVFDANRVLTWDTIPRKAMPQGGKEYSEVKMSVWEMFHKIPSFPNRVFNVMVLTAKHHGTSPESLLVVQIPVALGPGAIVGTPLATRTHVKDGRFSPGDSPHQKASQAKDCKISIGLYASVEWVTPQPKDGNIFWRMATTTDSKIFGMPKFIERLALPGAVNADVGLFMTWLKEKKRKGDVVPPPEGEVDLDDGVKTVALEKKEAKTEMIPSLESEQDIGDRSIPMYEPHAL